MGFRTLARGGDGLIPRHTDLDGACAIAEPRIPKLDGHGQLRVTASVGDSTSTEGDEDALMAEADAPLYAAKRQAKNRTIR